MRPLFFWKCTPSLCIYVCLRSHLCECMRVCHSFQGWGSRGWSRVHTMARNSGVPNVSLWNSKQTLRGSRPAWLELTNHPEAPARPWAAQHRAPGNGCLNIRNVMSVSLCVYVCICVCACGHVCFGACMRKRLYACKVWGFWTAHTRWVSISHMHGPECGQMWWWLLMHVYTTWISPNIYV